MAGKKKADRPEPVHVVQLFTSSEVIYGRDSRDTRENPDYHPPILLTNKGTFLDERHQPLDPKKVPEYVREIAKKTSRSIEFRPPTQKAGTLRDAMRGSGVQDPTGLDLNSR